MVSMRNKKNYPSIIIQYTLLSKGKSFDTSYCISRGITVKGTIGLVASRSNAVI